MGDERAYRQALGCFATGVAVIVADAPAGPVGITVNSFTSVSLTPRLVLWCLDDSSDRFPVFAAAPAWGVTILAAHDAARSSRFAGGGAFRLEPHEVERDATEAPTLSGGLAWFCARTTERHILGDHLAIVGEVVRFGAGRGDGLTYFRGRYGLAPDLTEPAP